MLSTFFARCLSDMPRAENWSVVPPSSCERVSASITLASNASPADLLSSSFALEKAVCSRGCNSDKSDVFPGCTLRTAGCLWCCVGEVDILVIVVDAVTGRSATELDMAALEDGGNFPVSSSFRILDRISSISSQTVDGAVVETVDSESIVG